MRKEISDLFLLLGVIPVAGILLYLPVAFLTEKICMVRKKHGYFCMKLLLLFYILMPIYLMILFMKNRKIGGVFTGRGNTAYLLTYKSSSLYYPYLEKQEFWILQIFFIIWVVGGILLFLIRDIRGRVQLKWIRKVSILQSGEQIAAIQKSLIEELGIKKEILVYQSDVLDSSFLAGIRKPAVFLPQKEFSDRELFCILRHEFIHYQKKDIWYRRVLLLVKGFYWINPLIYLFCTYFLDSCELSCDEMALEGQGKEVRLCYARAIYQFASADVSLKYVAGFGSGNMCVRRIRSIGKGNKIRKGISAVVLSGIMFVLVPVVSYAAAESVMQIQIGLWHILENIYDFTRTLEWNPNYIEFIMPVAEEEAGEEDGADERWRGIADIGAVIDGHYIVKRLELLRGDEVEIRLVTRDGKDKFSAGLSFQGRHTYVKSKDGGIVYTLKVGESGVYDIFIQSDREIWVTGVIEVE